MRSRLAFLGGLLFVQLAATSPATAQLSADSVKDLVMASLPMLFDSIWSARDEPVTIRLGRYAHVRPIFPTTVRAAPSAHDQDWLNRQLSTPLVLDLCDAVRVTDCGAGPATMVVGISEPALEPDGRLRIIVSVGRRGGDAPAGAGPTAVEFAVWLRRDSGTWTYDQYQMLEVT